MPSSPWGSVSNPWQPQALKGNSRDLGKYRFHKRNSPPSSPKEGISKLRFKADEMPHNQHVIWWYFSFLQTVWTNHFINLDSQPVWAGIHPASYLKKEWIQILSFFLYLVEALNCWTSLLGFYCEIWKILIKRNPKTNYLTLRNRFPKNIYKIKSRNTECRIYNVWSEVHIEIGLK